MATASSHHGIWLADALYVPICGVHHLIRCRDETRLLPYHELCYWQTWHASIVRTAFQDFTISHISVSTSTAICAVLACFSEFLLCGGSTEVITIIQTFSEFDPVSPQLPYLITYKMPFFHLKGSQNHLCVFYVKTRSDTHYRRLILLKMIISTYSRVQ